MKNLLYFCIILFVTACNQAGQKSSAPAGPVNVEGYALQDFGNNIQKASKKNSSNQVEEEGELINGIKSGTWVTYYPDGRIKSIANYINGKKNGIYLEMNDRGSVDLQCRYVDDVLDGKWVKYKFGSRAEKEINYKMGKMHGFYREFHNNGKMQKEVAYKDGIQHGVFRQFNDEEQVVMEYQYENGEKISGGIVTPPEK